MTNVEKQIAQVNDLIVESSQTLFPCCLCGAPTHDRGLFIPDNSKDWGAIGNKIRFFIYPACYRHNPDIDPTYHSRVEAFIRKQQAAGELDTIITTA